MDEVDDEECEEIEILRMNTLQQKIKNHQIMINKHSTIVVLK